MSSYLIIWTSTGLDIEDWVLPSTPHGRNNIVQTWTKSPIFSVQIQSHFFIFLWNHFKSNCLYWKSPMSLFWGLTLSANYSRTPRDYLIQRESVLFQPQAERTALYLNTAIVSHCHMVSLLSVSPAGSRDGCLLLHISSLLVASFRQQGYSSFSSLSDFQQLFSKAVTE